MPDKAVSYLLDHFEEKCYGSREFIVEAGKVERHFYLVSEGVQIIYIIDRNGDKVIMGFSYAGEVSGVYDSFIHQKPSELFLETLTPTRLIALNRRFYDELFQKFPEMTQWRANFFEAILLGRLSRETEILIKSAKERYDAFVERCPAPLLQIPQKYLASYLNMKPETFSRLRALRD